MDGTIPDTNQVPDNEPISNKIIIAGVTDLIEFETPSIIFFQLFPYLIPITHATAADSNRDN